jgi:hypothetical protein
MADGKEWVHHTADISQEIAANFSSTALASLRFGYSRCGSPLRRSLQRSRGSFLNLLKPNEFELVAHFLGYVFVILFIASR